MLSKYRFLRLSVLAGVAAMGSTAHAGPSPFMMLGQPVAAPAGYVEMCKRQSDLCAGPMTPLAQNVEPSVIDQTASLQNPTLAWAGGVESDGFEWTEDATYQNPDLSTVVEGQIDPSETLVGVDEGGYEAAVVPARAEVASIEAPAAVSVVKSTWLQRWLARGPVESILPTVSPQMALLNRVNAEVNRTVLSRTDEVLHGVNEYWSLPTKINGATYGDCEDFALEKRRLLIKAGLQPEMLSLAVAFTPQSQFHAVLVVRTETGDWVLDNLRTEPMPWHSLGYLWVERQVAGGSAWATLQ